MQIFALEGFLITIFAIIILANAIRILREYERGVVFRLGRLVPGGIRGPGLIILVPVIDKMVKVSLRTVVMDVPQQDVITQDNVSIKVNAVIYFRVMEPQKAIVEVENYLVATSQLSQTTLRSVLGQSELDDLLSQREKINQKGFEQIYRDRENSRRVVFRCNFHQCLQITQRQCTGLIAEDLGRIR